MKRLRYKKNYNNKLNCTYHSTIRLFNAENYHVGAILEEWEIERKLSYGLVEIVAVTPIYLDQLTAGAAMLDMGCNISEAKAQIHEFWSNEVKDWETQRLAYIIVKKIKEKDTQINLGL